MTEAVQQWMADEATKYSEHSQDAQDKFISGLSKGIEIAEGFAVWAAKNHWFRSLHDGDTWVEMKEPERELRQGRCFTTSQLLEKYLDEINKNATAL